MEKIYGGNAKMITTQFGDIWKVSQNRSDLEKLLKYMNENDCEWVNLDIKEKPNKVEGKPTHYLELYQPKARNDFRPAKEKNDWTPVVVEKKIIDKYENDTLPF
jgi:hypothetical protein